MLSVSLTACSVIEDRAVCPCWLKVSYENAEGHARYFIYSDTGIAAQGIEDVSTGPHMYEVPRDTICYSASFGIPDDHVAGSRYIIPEGQETALFYAFLDEVIEISSDFIETTVRPEKQYSDILVRFMEDISASYTEMNCVVASGTGGIDLCTLQPLEGGFRVEKNPSRDGRFTVSVPRQGFDDLTVTVYEKGQKLKTYDISGILEEHGYDWSEGSLRDVTVTLSLLTHECVVELGDWTAGGESNPEF